MSDPLFEPFEDAPLQPLMSPLSRYSKQKPESSLVSLISEEKHEKFAKKRKILHVDQSTCLSDLEMKKLQTLSVDTELLLKKVLFFWYFL